jgi:DinB superfamily
MHSPVTLLRQLLGTEPSLLAELSEAAAASKPSDKKWSAKEELGHLLDSAANNHLRIVRTLFEDQPAMPKYEQERWVQVHVYQQREWCELIETWSALNRQLLMAAASIPDSDWTRTCTIGGAEPVTLRFVVEDYVAHMAHHLSHIKEVCRAANHDTASANG